MGRRVKKKGTAGAAKNYITRNQAVRKLQLSLPDFRKLCIWKGIYPREPRRRTKANKSASKSTTFYYAKDIQYLLHEPIIQKFREQKSLEKKISRALGRGDFSDAARLEKNAARPEQTGQPRYTLDHVVRERYPTFQDALRDLDDCLSMLFLFANLPSTSAVPAKMIARCEKLCLQFQHYLILSRSVTKSFLSIKGIYYQANIHGEDITWVVPYKFKLNTAGDIDFRIMGSFVEFYMTLLGFVNFRLYKELGLRYPPVFDKVKDDENAELGAFSLQGLTLAGSPVEKSKQIEDKPRKPVNPETQAYVDRMIQKFREEGDAEDEPQDEADNEPIDVSKTIDKFVPVLPGGDVLPQPEEEDPKAKNLFADFTVYLSRETPRQPLEFLLKAAGCKRVGWDAVLGGGTYTTDELDPSITHQVIDRPPVVAAVDEDGDGDDNQTAQRLYPNRQVAGRIYIQPQWVWDSLNDKELKDAKLYGPGAQLPPHLSPFVKKEAGRYDPALSLDQQLPEGTTLEHYAAPEDEAEGDENGMDVEDEEGTGADEDVDDFEGFSADEDEGDDGDEVGSEDDEDADERPGDVKNGTKPDSKVQARRALDARQRKLDEDKERAKGMLSKKKRKLFEQMEYTNQKKRDEDDRLRLKRAKVDAKKRKA
jgi:pescadillo